MIINNVQFNVELEDILTELQYQLNANGIPYLQKIKNSGDDIMCQCPYHSDGQERRPSAGIRKSDGLFHCFTCNNTHSLPEVISYCFGYTSDILGKEGFKWLLKNFATVQVEERKDVEIDFARNVSSRNYTIENNKSNEENLNWVTEEELDKYRYTHPYMYKRKLTDEVIERFDIGYDKETDCITFPVRDIMGRCLFVARRSVKTKFFNYPKGVEKPLYGLYELNVTKLIDGHPVHILPKFPDEIIVCEGMFDALTCWVYGKYAVALNGLGNDLQFKQLRNLPCRKLILATDNDDAGMKARKRIRENVTNKIITEYVLPDGKKDINELTENEFRNLLEIF